MQFEALGFRNVNDLCQQVCAAVDSASSVKTNGVQISLFIKYVTLANLLNFPGP